MKTYSRKNSSYIKKAFIASNFNEMCRLCLSEVDLVLKPIFQDYKISYKDWIHYTVDVLIEEGDGLPPNICEECLAMVEQTYLFKKKCKASDSKLREHLELMQLNEEEKLNDIGLIDVSEDHKNLFEKKDSSESKCDESSAVDAGGTNNLPPNKKNKNLVVDDLEESSEALKIPKTEPEIQILPHDQSETQSLSNEMPEVHNLPDNQPKIQNHHKNKRTIKIPKSEPQEKVIINSVKRYILKGEKREDDQEEDLTVCEVVPLDVRNEESVSPDEAAASLTYTDFNNSNQNQSIKSICNDLSNNLTSGTIQEIYHLWNNEEPAEGEKGKKNEIMYLDVSWGDNSDKGVKKNLGMLEVDVEQNGVVQMHRIYTSKNQLEIIESIPDIRNSFKCFACTEEFFTVSEIKQHLVRVHKEVSDVAYCETCFKSFTCANSLKRHMAIHTGIKPYKCKICDRRFSQGSILKRHVLTHENLKPFNCHICKKSYTQKMNLLSHLKNHGLGTGTESYGCKLCNKSFVHQSGLSRHLKLHKGVRFLCIHCKRTFADSSALSRHIKVIHQHQK